jgi:transcriptional regulator GlxA family with amidase domain
LAALSFTEPIQTYLIAQTPGLVTTSYKLGTSPGNSSESILAPYSFAHPPENLDVLIVPGGSGTRAPLEQLLPTIEFIRQAFPRVKYLVSICTGNAIVARTGILDGRKATGNKLSWNLVTCSGAHRSKSFLGTSLRSAGPRVDWQPIARWVVDGNIYTTSGVSAGTDGFLQLIADTYGEEKAISIAKMMEYSRWTDASFDPFGESYGLQSMCLALVLLSG